MLLSLWGEDDQPVSPIKRRLMLETTTLTPLVKRMKVAALVRRTRSARDERQVIVSLTGARPFQCALRMCRANYESDALRDPAASIPSLKDRLVEGG